MRPCALAYAEELKRALDQDKPGWTQEEVWCPLHREHHELSAAPPGQLFRLGAQETVPGAPGALGARFKLLPGGLRCFHESTAEALEAPCAHCGASLHAHKDELGRVKSGRHGAGFLEERCPACHRANAVFPTRRAGGIWTSKLAEGVPAVQTKLG